MIKIRTLCTLVAIVWLLAVCCQPWFYEARWRECAEAAELLSRWTYTLYFRLACIGILTWNLVGGLAGGK